MVIYKSGFILILISVLCFSFLAAALFYKFQAIGSYEQPPVAAENAVLPTRSFSFPQSKEPAQFPILQLDFSPIQLNVPNLQPYLFFHGRNMREDAPKNPPELFFSLSPSKEVMPSRSGEKTYLVREGNEFRFSPKNQPTSLWFVPTLKGADVVLNVTVQNEDGSISQQPKSYSELLLKERPIPLPQPGWSIGAFRADQTLLMRQGAKWAGRDLFLEMHGGDEYQFARGKERILFKNDEGQYDLYFEPGAQFVFDSDHWREVKKGEDVRGQPILKVAKVDEKLITLELYSASGAQKFLYSLIKQPDLRPILNQSEFVYVGARTKVHSLFKVSGKREIVGVGDWLIRSSEGWMKIKSAKEIDRYIEGLLEGPLLVIDGIEEQNGQKGFKGTLLSVKRSQAVDVFLPFSAVPQPKAEVPAPEEEPPPEQ
jgi:hypothetical protein